MEITWLGRTCFRLRGRGATVVTDPCPPESGYRIGKPKCDIVTLGRRDDQDYSWTDGVHWNDGSRVLDAPGEYEVGGVLITGIGTGAPEPGRNVAFAIEIDGIRILHLGLPSASPTAAVLKGIEGVDVLLMPVGGGISLSGSAVTDIMETLDPHIAVPMHYKTPVETAELDFLDAFLKETGLKLEPQDKLQVTRSSVPEELTVQVLTPKG